MEEILDIKKAKIVLGVVVALLLFLGAIVVGVRVWSGVGGGADRPLTAVLLDTGDMYFGKLSYFPRLSLEEVYTVQTITDPESPVGASYQVVPLRFAIWGPEKIILNYDKIVFIGKVGEDSQVMQIIKQQSQ